MALAEPLETSREALLAVLDAAGAVRGGAAGPEPAVVLCARAPAPSALPHPRAHWLHPSWLLDSAAAHAELPRDDYGSILHEEPHEEEEDSGADSPSLQLSD